MAEVADIPQPPVQDPQQVADPQPPDKVAQYYDYLKKAGADVAPSLDSFKKTLSNDSTARQYYGYLKNHHYDAPPDYGSFARTLGTAASAPTQPNVVPAEPEHQISHTPIQDIRHLNDLANQPVRSTTTTLDPTMGGSTTETNQEDVARNKAYQDQYEKSIGNLATNWGTDPKSTKQALEDFPTEPDQQKLKRFAGLATQNPVYYTRLKSANDIRMAIAASGGQGVKDANVFNHLQTSDNYEQLQGNIALQQQIMRKHGLGQEYFEKLKQSQAPLINTLDPGLNIQYWNSDDKKLGLSDFQYAGLETEKMFNPGKYQQDMAIIKANRGLDEPNQTPPVPQGKKGYAYDRGVENVLFALENQGRQNTGSYISQRSSELGPQIEQVKQQYQQYLTGATDPDQQKAYLDQFHTHPIIQEAAKLEEGQQSIDYARTEDQRRFPLNYGDQASRLVKDAMSSTLWRAGVAGNQVLLGAGESADNTARFIKNTFVNLVGSEQLKAENAATNIGHQALTALAGYQGSAYSMQEQPLIIGDGLVKSIQDTFNDKTLSTEQKNQKATDLVLNHQGDIKVNPAAGQQNITGKAIIYSASNTIGQILGIADQSLLMGGLLGDASKAQQMANAVAPMYASTQNQLYEQALARGDEKPLLSSHLDAAIISLASMINPDLKVVKGMVGAETGIGKIIAGVDESTWNKVLSDNKTLVDRMVAGTKATARQLSLANLQYGLIVPTAQYVVHKNILNEDPNLGDTIKDGLIQTSISMALPALFHGVWGGVDPARVNPSQKYAIVEAGLHPKENIELVDQQVEKGQITPDRADQIREIIKQTGQILEKTEAVKTDGTWMNEQEVSDLTYQMLRKKVLEGKLKNAPDPQKSAIEAKIHDINVAVSDLHTSEADKQKTDLNQLLTSHLDQIKDKIPTMEGQVREAIKRNEPEQVFKEIYDQATETTNVDGKEVSSRAATEETFGKPLVEKAFELHKQKTTSNAEHLANTDQTQAGDQGQVTPEKPPEGAAPETTGAGETAAPSFAPNEYEKRAHEMMSDFVNTGDKNKIVWSEEQGKVSVGIGENTFYQKGGNPFSIAEETKVDFNSEEKKQLNKIKANLELGDISRQEADRLKNELAKKVIQRGIDEKVKQWDSSKSKVDSKALTFLQSRHADTIHDEQGIVSGPNNKELSPKGKRDANDLAKDVEGKGVTNIITSGLERSKETGDRVAEKIGAKVENRPELNTWDIKDFDGLTDEEFKDIQQWFVENPNSSIYQGPLEKYRGKEVGESVNEYAERIIPAMEKIEKESGPETLLINHSNNMMLWDAYLKNGREWNDQAREDYLKSEKPEAATLTNQTDKNAVQEPGAGSVLQHPQEGAGGEGGERGGVEPGQQGQAPPGQTGGEGEGQEPPGGTGGQTIAAGEEDDRKVGPSHDAMTALALRLGLTEPERGTVLTPAEYAARGRIMIAGGADPEKVARTFERTGNISPDIISVARAHLENLEEAADTAGDQHGHDSEEYKAALGKLQKWIDDVMKPMGTRAGETLTSLQGTKNMDTGSFTSMQRQWIKLHREQLTEKQAQRIRELSKTVSELKKDVSDITDKLSKVHQKPSTPKQSRAPSGPQLKKKAADLAKKIRDNGKLNRPDMFSSATPASLVWDAGVEIVAKAVEAGGIIGDAIAKGIDHIQASDWYKGLSDPDKKKASDEFANWHIEQADKKTSARIKALEKQLSDLQEGKVKTKGSERLDTDREKELKDQIFDQKNKMGLIPPKSTPQPKVQIPQQSLAEKMVNKRDNAFTPEDASDIWAHVKENYLDKGQQLGDALRGTSTDLGLSADQILHAIASPKGGKELTTELFKKQYERNKAMNFAKQYVETANESAPKRFFKNLPSAFFTLKTYGHGTVGNITHAATNIFRPTVWSAYWPNVFKSFALAYGKAANYEKVVTLLESRPNFDAWKAADLAVDPRKGYDDYQVFGKKQTWLGEAGTRGFTGLKLMRYDLAEKWYNQASATERADPKFREEIAKLVNHATGHSEVKVGGLLKAITFAPGLEVSRWQRMIGDPAKAANTFLHWKTATPAEKAAAKIVMSGGAQHLGIYAAALAANAGLLAALGSKQKVNWDDPSHSDWLKIKLNDKTLDLTGGVLGPIRLLNTVGKLAYEANMGDKKDIKMKPNDKDASILWQQLRYKASPLTGDVLNLATGQDAMGNTLPWSKVPPGKGRKQLDKYDYASDLLLPIPIAAGFNAYEDTMDKQGVPANRTKAIWNGALTGIIEGFTGAKYEPDYSLEEKGGSGGGGGAGGSFSRAGGASR